tara:strand:+ start:718 stop:897 length:180 start_codon:yes stop_codon:yes gene_type:complete
MKLDVMKTYEDVSKYFDLVAMNMQEKNSYEDINADMKEKIVKRYQYHNGGMGDSITEYT